MDAIRVAVTGAFGALGAAVVRRARDGGAVVAALDQAAAPADAQARVGAHGLALGGIDLSTPAAADSAMDAVRAALGGLDVLVNVAGAFRWEPLADGKPETWDFLHRVNLLTAVNASRAATPLLIASGRGAIVNIGAGAALKAAAGMGPYAASKAGVHRLTESLAEELKGKVTVNAVLPSTIDTPANRRDMPDADFSKWVAPDDLADVILFLASNRAITGALVPVNGQV
ncbi:MAG: SDR family NAD(P)-dependent oxidoreductase [Hyphomonadaceae bacterium]|nr:SDR family NAD(P)-dependent oxidoreductase [Hyphomonadaceae bacterium]